MKDDSLALKKDRNIPLLPIEWECEEGIQCELVGTFSLFIACNIDLSFKLKE